MTKLLKPVRRVTIKDFRHYRKPLVVSLIPGTDTRDELIGFRLLGTRKQINARVSDLYTMAALWHGQQEAKAKKQARAEGIRWSRAKKQFNRNNLI